MAGFRDIFVIGSSLGGVEALRRLLGQLPAGFGGAVAVVQHTAPGAALDRVLSRATPLPVRFAEDGETFEAGTVHLAPPDRHLLIEGKRVRTLHGPRENGARPAIDPLFRSAAAHHGPRVVGMLLTGLRDDGTAGLEAIQRSGGVTVVQDPDDAAHPDMPASALETVAIDHVLPIAEMGALMRRLLREPAPAGVEAPADVVREARITARYGRGEREVNALGRLSAYDCPGCGGSLWEIQEASRSRFRCYVGHAYSERALAEEQARQAEGSLLVALRTLEERSRMLQRMSEESRRCALQRQAEVYAREADEAKTHAEVLRELLASLGR